MRKLLLAGIIVCAAGLGVAYARRHAKWQEERPHYTGAAAVVERFQCHRCHDAPGKLVPAISRKHCVHCHQEILEDRLEGDYDPEKKARWKENIKSLTLVPSLTGVERLRREWLVEFLQHPHDLRPGLDPTMPRLAVTAADAQAIADHFTPPRLPEAPVRQGDVARGRALFATQKCGDCHAFTGAVEDRVRTREPVVRLAPDLRHTRARMAPSSVLAWLRDPATVKADALMPRLDLTEEERLDLVAFVVASELAPVASRAVPSRLPVLERPVPFEEVSKRVFKRVCWHCHSDPEPVGGDGGPGNTGGFGFKGRGLDLSSPPGPRREGMHLVEALMARHVEVAGGEVPGVRGMPLGLPPMSLEEIQLVETWLAQGAKGD